MLSLLIVDDEELELEIIQNMIDRKKLGIFNIFTAKNIACAKKILTQYYTPLILCDIEMPGGSGLELAEWIRSRNIEAEIIFLTGYAWFSYARSALKLGVRDYLLKPVEREPLMEALEKAIGHLPDYEDDPVQMNTDQLVKKITEYIQDNCEKEISRKTISKIFYIHPDYFSHIFKEQTGCSFIDYLIQVRMEKARKLLCSTDQSLVNIALAVGYSNTAHFGKHFKRETGMTPGAYRKKARKKDE